MHRVVDGLIVSNGLGWTADGRTMFHSDSKGQVIWAYDYDPDTGTPSDRREVARPTEEVGRPDGAAIDEQGYYWSAGISAGRAQPVVAGRPAGPDRSRCRARTRPRPCFGGPDLRTIFVTSLRHDLRRSVLAAKPLSGGIFAVQVDVPGVPIGRYPRLTTTRTEEGARPMLNVCMVGHGMMGIWHSEALREHRGLPAAHRRRPAQKPDAESRDADRGPQAGLDRGSSPRSTATRSGRTDFDEAIADPEVDIVIIAGPSETHAEMSLAALEQGKHMLVEIPIAMNLEGAEAVVAAAEERGLTLGVVHPMRYRTERLPVVERIRAGEEQVSHVQGRFFIHRLAERGRHRPAAQLDRQPALAPHHAPDRLRAVDGLAAATWPRAEERIRRVYSVYPPIDAAHRHPDGAGAGRRDPRRPDDRRAPAPTTRGSTSTTRSS